MKKIIGFIVLTMLGLSGIFLILAVRAEKERTQLKRNLEIRAKKMQENYDEAIKRINSSKKPRMVKI